jgi:hypothetical protein
MVTPTKYKTFISKLRSMTETGKQKWEKMKPPSNLTSGTDDIISAFYGTIYKDRKIGIYEERFRSYYPEYHEFYWSDRIVIAFFNEEWEKLWEFPQISGDIELLKAVEYQVADVNNIVDTFIKNKNEG